MHLRYGFASRVINPHVPISLAGYFNVRMWRNVLDDIEVRAVVFNGADGTDGAILHFDLVTVPGALQRDLLAEMERRGLSRFDVSNVIICATHSHTAPEIRVGNQGHNPEYMPFLVTQAADALEDAIANLHDGTAFHGCTADSRFIFNRRYWMKNGHVMTNPGKGNPEIVRPEGEIDPEIPFLLLKDTNGAPELLLCSIVNHSDTIGGSDVSADWHHFLRERLRRTTGVKMVVSLLGAEGNINHFDVNSSANQTCYAEAERIGNGYAETLEAALAKPLAEVSGDCLRVMHGIVQVPPREIALAELAQAREIVKKYADLDINAAGDMTSEDLAKGKPVVLKFFAEKLAAMASRKECFSFDLVGFAFGDDAVIASLPSEPFTEIGLELRKGIFGGRTCCVACLAGTGDNVVGTGYIPNAWNYGRGGYEDTPRSSPFGCGTADALLQEWRRIAQ